MPASEAAAQHLVSVVIPARDEGRTIGATLAAVFAQEAPGIALEVIVVDDGSRDDTALQARAAGARVLEIAEGSPAAARNRGAALAQGDPIVFLDADCTPAPGWLAALLAAHAAGAAVVGGSLELAPGLSASARCDHYCGSYHVHPRRPAGPVPNHPPANLSVRRDCFRATAGFTETFPVADGHEELAWQAELRARGATIRFEPRAMVWHHNHPGLGNLLRRHYRWGYSALESKAATGTARLAWAYRHPRALLAAAVPFGVLTSLYTLGCWLRAGALEPVVMFPAMVAARAAWVVGFVDGGLAWLARRDGRDGRGGSAAAAGRRPRWR
ncbi:MAG TPA: glycosyltransferase [Gemmatimonadales bacterium]|nr:glycosyltransferase [Gemmatimonadales bacterium]